ncbi:uncharacterized protein [Salminus brasiliensis]|uniref:uncharacterized protein n=1 Tax=Salminus brasiliensis TaxID=930266 RepID=UPI003B837F02
MVRECFVQTCNNKQKTWSATMFHRLPLRDESRLRLWLQALGVDPDTPADRLRGKVVCEEHFQPCDYYEKMELATRTMRRFLRDTAVPSVGVVHPPERAAGPGDQDCNPKDEPSPAPRVPQPDHKFPLVSQQRSAPSCTALAQRTRRRQKVFSEKENTPTPLSTCSEVGEKSWRKAVKSLQTYQGTSIFKTNEVLVNTQCLLELFQYCWLCQIECCITIEGHERLFSITQDCQSCGHHRQWRSHPTSAGESVEASHTEHKDHKKHFLEEHKVHEDDAAASDTEEEHTLQPRVEDSKEVVVQIVSSDNEDTDQKSEDICADKDGSCSSNTDEESGREKEGKKKKGKRKSNTQDSSDEWEPRLDEGASDSDVSLDEDEGASAEDSPGKVVMWCTVCKTDATLSCSLHRHSKAFGCVQCGAGDNVESHSFEKLLVQFDDFPSFQEHAEKEHGAKPFRTLCQECGKLLITEPKSSGGKDHICEHKLKRIVCPECGKRFLTEVGLKRHFSKLHKDADHPCKYCLKLFKNRPSKLEHEQTHPKEKEPYSCPDCPERFDNIHRRNSHLKLHRGPYKYACDSCGKRFRDIIKLKRHKLIHSGEKPFKCHVCDRSFNQIGNLSSHMRLHTGEKPFMCEQCGECFNHNVSLKNHLLRYHQSSLSQVETQVSR